MLYHYFLLIAVIKIWNVQFSSIELQKKQKIQQFLGVESNSRIERLERTVTDQSKVIKSQTEEIKYLKDVAQSHKALLQHTSRMAIDNKRRTMMLRAILMKSGSTKNNDKADLQKAETHRSNTTSDMSHRNLVGRPQYSESLLQNIKGRSVHIRQGENGRFLRTSASDTCSERTGVAFSAYLDHDVDLGLHQNIRFNQVITNEGNSYNPYSGIFTCPEAGVYLLSFFIGERPDPADVKEFAAELMVNNVNIVNAVVDSFHRTQDIQGGNTVIIRLKQGDVVWISAMSAGIHAEGSSGLRISTFSGAFLYA